jgi:hypothetical protein
VHDIPPAPEEDFMPPINSCTYRVLFYYAAYRTSEEFWKNEGKYQSKSWDKFIGPGPVVKAAVNNVALPTDTPDQKLRKIYAAVMQLENTRFKRQQDGEQGSGIRHPHRRPHHRRRKANRELTRRPPALWFGT